MFFDEVICLCFMWLGLTFSYNLDLNSYIGLSFVLNLFSGLSDITRAQK